MAHKVLLIMVSCLALAGCWNGGNTHVSLGDVSLGQQLLDLKTAYDEGAISEDEYDETRESLLALNSLCDNTDDDDWF